MDEEKLIKYIKDLVNKAIESGKEEAQITSSYSRVTYNELGVPLVEGIGVAINGYKSVYTKYFENLVKALQYKRDFMIIDEAQYYAELEKLRNTYLIKGSADWWKYTAQIIEYEQGLTEAAHEEEKKRQQLTEDSLEATRDYYEQGLKAQQEYANKLRAYGDNLFKIREVVTNFETDAVEAKATLVNYEAYINRLKRYQQEFTRLKERGIVPDDMLSEITRMDYEEAMEYINLLNRTPDGQLKEYIEDRNEYIALTQSMAEENIGFQPTEEDYNNYVEKMEAIFEKAGLILPENFYQLGADGADNFGEGFLKGIAYIEDELSSSFTDKFKTSLEDAARLIGEGYIQLMMQTGEQTANNVVNNVNNSFTIGTEKESSAQQISQWRNAQTIERLRSN